MRLRIEIYRIVLILCANMLDSNRLLLCVPGRQTDELQQREENDNFLHRSRRHPFLRYHHRSVKLLIENEMFFLRGLPTLLVNNSTQMIVSWRSLLCPCSAVIRSNSIATPPWKHSRRVHRVRGEHGHGELNTNVFKVECRSSWRITAEHWHRDVKIFKSRSFAMRVNEWRTIVS
jgi:hypothetical protein